MLNQLKGLKTGLKEVNIRIIKDSLQDIQDQLLNYKYDNKEVDEVKEYQIYKIYKLMQHTDIFNLSFIELENYIIKLINIIEFIEL